MKKINLHNVTESLSSKEMKNVQGGSMGEDLSFLFCCSELVSFTPGGHTSNSWPWDTEVYCYGAHIAAGPMGREECEQAASQSDLICRCQGSML